MEREDMAEAGTASITTLVRYDYDTRCDWWIGDTRYHDVTPSVLESQMLHEVIPLCCMSVQL